MVQFHGPASHPPRPRTTFDRETHCTGLTATTGRLVEVPTKVGAVAKFWGWFSSLEKGRKWITSGAECKSPQFHHNSLP